MTVSIVIPARYASSRFPGKPLALLRDRSGSTKPLIQRSWEAAMAVDGIRDVFVATDDARISAAVEAFGGRAIMTSTGCRNGTERCAEAMAHLAPDTEVVVNLQGDAPLTPPWFIEALVAGLTGSGADVATPVLRCDVGTYRMFREDRRAGRVGGTTAVFDTASRALYFSKEVLPYLPESCDLDEAEGVPVFHHVGAYAYRPVALARYARLPEGPLERLEGLEQLRFLENGMSIHCCEVEARGRVFWELNNPVDVERLERVL